MNRLNKNIATLALAMLLMLSFSNLASANSHPTPSPPPLSEQDKVFADNALRFLTNVVRLNTSSYHIETRIDNEVPVFGFEGKTVIFNCTSAKSRVSVLAQFKSDDLFWYMLSPVKGSPDYLSPTSSDVLSNAKDTLDRLQEFSAKEYLPKMQNMLNPITDLQNSKTSSLEFTQEITVKENDITISWMPFANGLSNQQNQLTLEFRDSNLVFFADYLGTYSIGSSDAKISEEQAIEIAIAQARAFTWVQGNETVSNVNVIEKPFFTKLSLQNRGNATLYPLWEIKLGLDKMYPGGVTSFQVFIWADTGEVASVRPIGAGGVPTDMPTQSPAASPTNNQAGSDYTLAIISALVAATLVIGGLMIYKRKK